MKCIQTSSQVLDYYDVWLQEEECVILFGRTMQKLSNVRKRSCRGVGESWNLEKRVQLFLKKKIDLKFIVPRDPWWGGFYERLLKSVKLPLKKIFGNAMLDAEQMATVLTEIEAQINSRPLTYVGAEPNDLNALTPAQILIGRKLQAFPGKDTKVTEHTSNALKKRFQYHHV